MILLLLLVLFPATYGWNCETHEYVCDKAGFADYDCCKADNNDFQLAHDKIEPKYHHCFGNTNDCNAIESMERYSKGSLKEDAEIVLHLLADSMVPAHWWRTYYDQCHGPFENLVDEKLNETSFEIEYRCELKNGSIFMIKMDKKYLDHVSEYIINYTQGIPANRSSQYLSVENCTGECGYVIPYKQELLFSSVILLIILLANYRRRSIRLRKG